MEEIWPYSDVGRGYDLSDHEHVHGYVDMDVTVYDSVDSLEEVEYQDCARALLECNRGIGALLHIRCLFKWHIELG